MDAPVTGIEDQRASPQLRLKVSDLESNAIIMQDNSADKPAEITVEVAYALPNKQKIIQLKVPVGATAEAVVRDSGIVEVFPEIDLETAKMGIFGKAIKPASQILQDGDRVEIYRPLQVDPKASRKQRAAKSAAGKSDE